MTCFFIIVNSSNSRSTPVKEFIFLVHCRSLFLIVALYHTTFTPFVLVSQNKIEWATLMVQRGLSCLMVLYCNWWDIPYKFLFWILILAQKVFQTSEGRRFPQLWIFAYLPKDFCRYWPENRIYLFFVRQIVTASSSWTNGCKSM